MLSTQIFPFKYTNKHCNKSTQINQENMYAHHQQTKFLDPNFFQIHYLLIQMCCLNSTFYVLELLNIMKYSNVNATGNPRHPINGDSCP